MRGKTRVPLLTLIILAVNVAVYFYIEWNGSSYDTDYMIQMGAVYDPLVLYKHEFYRMFTHFFLHFGFDHLFNNMVSLLVLGFSLEQAIGKWRFATIYFSSGILAGVTSIIYNVYVCQETVSCGASGAIYGLMGALLILLIAGSRGRWTSEVPRYLLFLAFSIYSGMQDPSIDNAAHIGGFVAGALICLIMTRFVRMEVSYEN